MKIFKKAFCLTFVFVFLTISVISQILEKKYGFPNVSEQCMSSMSTYDDGFVLAVRGNNQSVLWLIKTDRNGQILYSHTIKIQDYNFFSGSTVEAFDGGIITSGGYALLGPNGWTYPNVISIDNCGDILWCKYIAINGGWTYRIKEASPGNYVLHTRYASNNIPTERNQMWGIDATSKINWFNQIVPEDEVPFNGTEINDFTLTSDKGFLLTGYCYYPDPQNPGWDRLQYLLVKTDSIGNAEWIQPNGLDTNNIGALYSCIQHGNAYYSVGFWYGPTDTIVSPCLNKYNLNGNLIYSSILHSDTLNNMLVDVDILNDTTLAMVGKCTHGYFDFIYMGVFTADTFGNLIYSMQNENGAPLEECLTITKDKKLFCTGYTPISGLPHFDAFAIKLNANLEYDSIYTQSFTYDSLCPYPIVSDTVLCNCEPFVGLDKPVAVNKTATLGVSPNPATGKFVVKTENMPNAIGRLQVFSVWGKQLTQLDIPAGDKEITVHCEGWVSGLYLVRVEKGGMVVSGKVVIR